jgi:cytochrome P450/ferredoxin-NADP reductase
MINVPVYDADFYADDFIRDPWPHYERMRDLGPVVWLPRHENYALTRYDEVALALRDHDTFISGKGVAADARANELTLGNSAASDGDRHTAIRSATSVPLLPGALEKVRTSIEEAAEELIDKLIERSSFDAIADIATHLPLTIVRDLVGLPDFGRNNMLRWANATFDLLGVQNARGKAAIDVFLEQRRFAQSQVKPENLKPGSWTRRLVDLVEQGTLAPDLAPVAMRDYLNPSLDTTISATGQLIYQMGKNPDQWRLLLEKPELARNAANEAVRMASPVRSFSRHTARPVNIAGVAIPENARVMMLFASANRDHRAFANPNKFDITRNPRRHLGFGSGIHMCVGMHLAQMEMTALLTAMIPRVKEIRVGDPVVALNNTIYGFASLPMRFVPELNRPPLKRQERAVEETHNLATFRGRIIDREELAENIIGLEIRPLDGESFPPWSPGAHIDVHIHEGLIRQYSLTGPMRHEQYSIAIQRELKSRGGSSTLHAKFEKGSTIVLSRPRNHFPLNEIAPNSVLFSGGIGITPILAMAWRLHELGRYFTWHVSARSRRRLPWASQIDKLPFREKIYVHLGDGPAEQQLNAAQSLRALDVAAHVYVCGPRGYMDHVKKAALEQGIAEENIHQEHFSAEIDVNGDPFVVIAARSGKRFEVSADETIINAALRAGIVVETSCRNGVCGTCITWVLQGRPDHRDMVLTAAEKAENDRMAVCCSRSQSSVIVLDL